MNYEKLKEQLEEEYPGNIFQIITVGDLFINDIKEFSYNYKIIR